MSETPEASLSMRITRPIEANRSKKRMADGSSQYMSTFVNQCEMKTRSRSPEPNTWYPTAPSACVMNRVSGRPMPLLNVTREC